ncbi:MAG TPA: peptidoglycan-associated lipoprotein Pal [Solirubrobacter sp.]|nr:peptidoglycan-associated lipoprotein Pal [Solirubrobacter sp.]
MKLLRMVAVMAAVALAGCSHNAADEAAANGAGAGAGAGAGYNAGQPAPDTVEYFNQVVGDRVFFGTDEYTLDAQAQETLRRQAEWLSAHPATTVTVEGHADERGTRAYNLALGARRANSAREFLVAQGVAPTRVRAVTYGKERPVALCSAESCWSQNRRAVSVVVGMPTG